jgi:hypothetical protein
VISGGDWLTCVDIGTSRHPKGTVSTVDAARSAGLTYRQVSYWIAHGVITPAYGNGGSGTRYRFTEHQAEILRQIGLVHRVFGSQDVVVLSDLVRRIWDALSATGEFRCYEGPLSLCLPWPHDALEEAS